MNSQYFNDFFSLPLSSRSIDVPLNRLYCDANITLPAFFFSGGRDKQCDVFIRPLSRPSLKTLSPLRAQGAD